MGSKARFRHRSRRGHGLRGRCSMSREVLLAVVVTLIVNEVTDVCPGSPSGRALGLQTHIRGQLRPRGTARGRVGSSDRGCTAHERLEVDLRIGLRLCRSVLHRYPGHAEGVCSSRAADTSASRICGDCRSVDSDCRRVRGALLARSRSAHGDRRSDRHACLRSWRQTHYGAPPIPQTNTLTPVSGA